MKRIRQADNDRVEFGIGQHLVVAAENLFRRILRGKFFPPFFVEITRGVQMAKAGSLNPFCMPFTRPTQADYTHIVFVHDSPRRKSEKSRDVNISAKISRQLWP